MSPLDTNGKSSRPVTGAREGRLPILPLSSRIYSYNISLNHRVGIGGVRQSR
jgi:hypothetical protein